MLLKIGSGGLDSAKCMNTSPLCGGSSASNAGSRILASVYDEKIAALSSAVGFLGRRLTVIRPQLRAL